MRMLRFLTKITIYFLFFWLFFIPSSTTEKVLPDPLLISLNVDSNFTTEEYIGISNAALRWELASGQMVKFAVKSQKISENFDPLGNLINERTFKKELFVWKTDSQDVRLNLIEWALNIQIVGYYADSFILLVPDRLQPEEFESVVMHELGHLLQLAHTPTIMTPTAQGPSCISALDLQQFCEKHQCYREIRPECN